MKKIFGKILIGQDELEYLLSQTYELGFSDGEKISDARAQSQSKATAEFTINGKNRFFRGT